VKNPWKWFRTRREQFAAGNGARISLPELERALASVEPAARLVPPRLLRRVVRLHTSLPGLGFRVPHSKSYVIAQKALLEIADRDEIGYGPTENTTFTCCHEVREERDLSPSVPIGRPIANTRVYVLDSFQQPVPVGVRGELYAGGDGVACGYLHQPELTAE